MLKWEHTTTKPKTSRRFLFYVISNCVIFLYLLVDIIHHFNYRAEPYFASFSDAYYESFERSVLKWIFSVLMLGGLVLDYKRFNLSFYLLCFSSIGILASPFVNGSYFYLIKGSWVFNLLIIETLGTLLLFYSFFVLIKRYNIKTLYVFLTILVSLILNISVLWMLPIAILP